MSEYRRWLANPPPGEELVISGISGRLPESDNIHEFGENLFNKKDMVTKDNRRWNIDHPEIPNRSGKVNNIDKFDCGFFGYHYRHADVLHPSVRLLLETAVESIIDAGINPVELTASRTGVFIGTNCAASEIAPNDIFRSTPFALIGVLGPLISNMLSYHLKLKGPSMTVDATCSSTFHAFDEAVRAIRSGQCDSALVGGANLTLQPGSTLQLVGMGALSKDGTCKGFDQSADGYVRSEAVGFILLQKQNRARRIYCQVLNSKVNSDGFKEQGIMFPSAKMQSQLMTEILEESGIDADELDYLEMHGTGTEVGDVEEVAAVDLAIAQKRTKPLLIGAVKSNIGHSEASSGISSLFKVIIALETGLIPPNLHLKNTKKEIVGLIEGRMKVVTELTKLEREDALVGVKNMGFGGTNSQILLKRSSKQKLGRSLDDALPRLVCVSGRTQEAALSLLEDKDQRLLDVEHVALLHQIFKLNFERHNYRAFTVVTKNGPVQLSTLRLDHLQAPWHVYLGDFTDNFRNFGQHLLQYECFENIVRNINTHLNDPKFDVIEVIRLNKKTEYDVLASLAVQVAFLELLEVLEIKPNLVRCKSVRQSCGTYFSKMLKNINGGQTNQETTQPVMILNLSDEIMNGSTVRMVDENKKVPFLEVLGRLYLEGYNPQIHKLYPEIQFPVSRGTPMVAPMIKWNHHKSWYSYKFVGFGGDNHGAHTFSATSDEHKYILGHVIDGRNLFPATEYLNIVWKTFATSRQQLQKDVPVVLENCRFVKAVSLPQSEAVTLSVSIRKGNGDFVVADQNSSVIVSGTIHSPEDISEYQTDLAPHEFDFEDPIQVIEQDDIYRELNLRGYNYSGSFRGLLKCSADPTSALIQWENNWTTFMDIMLQRQMLQLDTRSLYIPTLLRKLAINPMEHLEYVSKQTDSVCPVYTYKDYNLVRSGGIEIFGVQVSSINKRSQIVPHVLEKHVFVPNIGRFDLPTALRVVVQTVLENSLENNVKGVEFSEGSKESDFLWPLLVKALDDLPKVTHEFVISSENGSKQLDGVRFEKVNLASNSNMLLIVATNVLQASAFPSQIFNALSPSGFVLTREGIDFVPRNEPKIEILLELVTDKEKLILCRKSRQLQKSQFIEINSNNLNWIPLLQKVLKGDDNIVIVAQNHEPEGVLGFLNCIRRESPGDRVKCFFMMDEAPPFDPQDPFYRDQLKKDLAVNIYKNGSWGNYRHLLLEDIEGMESEHCYVACTKRGDLSSLKWIEGPLTTTTKLTPNEIIVYPYYAALNFRDVMTATGRMSVDSITKNRVIQDYLQGIEFSGRDESGRRVIGMTTHGALSTMISIDRNHVIEVPEFWSLDDAATTFVVYVTAIYALLEVGRLRKGASVLVHSGTGGVGLAALNLCVHYNCEIFVTVGTQEKREYIQNHFPQIPESHIGNSRDTSFEMMVKRETRNRGVDFVLNSLAEDKLLASVRCLASGGFFLEIGKFDIGKNTELNLLKFEKNISFHGIMLDRMETPEMRTKINQVFVEGVKKGFVKPLPKTVFQRHEIEKSFRFMTTGNHIGKVLIEIRNEESEDSTKSKTLLSRGIPRFNCEPTKSYIIIGGLGGFGLELADWLYLRGAKKIILVSRSGIKTGYQTLRIKTWRSYGVTVKVSTADVTTKTGCFDLLKEANELGYVDGIFNLAVILQDAAFENQTPESFVNSLAPKARTSQHLDQLSRRLCPELRYFVLFSSVSCGRGNAGQTNYGMANSIMERICENRQLAGLPGLAIQWGVIGDVGLVAKMQKENKELIVGGTLQQKIASCLEVLDILLRQSNPVVSSMVVAKKKKGTSNSPVAAVASILGIRDIKTVGYYKTLTELGMDSITRTEILQVLEKDFGIYFSADDVRNLTFARLQEMETERQDVTISTNKLEDGTTFILQHVPRPKPNAPTIERIPSGIKDDASGTTVIVFPGLDGEMKALHPIVDNLRAHVFGACYSYHNPEDSVQQLAQNLLPHIELVCSEYGTFNIIGYSFGALVALEVVGLLESKGYRGSFFVIEGSPAYLKAAVDKFLSGKSESEMQTFLLIRMLCILLPAHAALEQTDNLQQMQSFEDRIEHAKFLFPLGSKNEDLDSQAAVAFYERVKSLIGYRFNNVKIKCSVFLFRAEIPVVNDLEADYGLSTVCDQQVNVTVIRGDHESVLKDSKLLDWLNKQLND